MQIATAIALKCKACGHEGAVSYDFGPDGEVAAYCIDIPACGRRRHENETETDSHIYSTSGWDWHN